MRTLLHPFLPNGPGGDPLVWVDLLDEGQSVLFDLGDLHRLSPKKLLRVDRVIVTHTHMDHFIGFDQLLRIVLRRERELRITGPTGFVDQLAARLDGYSWNLIESYPLRLIAEEIDGERIRSAAFTGPGRMKPEPLPDRPFHGTAHAHRAYTIRVDSFDHGIPVLGCCLRETEHLSVDRDRLLRMGLVPGPWLAELKANVRQGGAGDETVDAARDDGTSEARRCDELTGQILTRSPGQSLAYLTDLADTPANRERALALADQVDLLICETAFLDEDRELARERSHLTARQAGEIARAAGAGRLAPFHFSPRYHGREEELLEEAASAFGGPVVRLPSGADGTLPEPDDRVL